MKKKIVSCFDIGEVPRSPGKWNWNWLYFLPFIFTFEQGDRALGGQKRAKNKVGTQLGSNLFNTTWTVKFVLNLVLLSLFLMKWSTTPNFKFVLYLISTRGLTTQHFILLVSHSEYPRYKPFLMTPVLR